MNKYKDVAGELIHMCSDCGKGFIHKSSLTFHLWEHKKNPKQKILENSAKKTKKFVEKCGNLLESDDYINVRCKLCEFECKAGRLSTHMRYVHPNEYFECQNDMVTCSHCDEKFSVKRGKSTSLNNKASKNEHFLILLSSLGRYSKEPNLKIIFEIL